MLEKATVAALGRPFKLGALYDAGTDRLVQGGSLWDPAALRRMTTRRPHPYSNFHISSSDSAEERASLLELQASLRASVLCGFVEADGSAKYLHDRRQFRNQCRVTLQYKATTHFEQLCVTPGDWEGVRDTAMVENGLATHVVTAIEYGANAFFAFDSQILAASDVREFRLKLSVVVNFILWSVRFDYNRDLTEEQKSLVKNLTVKFYSDFLLESPPATFAEAVHAYTNMTKLLGDEGQNAVPVKVWMTPLKYFLPKAAKVVRDISVGLVILAETALEDLSDARMRCDDCLSIGAVGKFAQLRDQLDAFNKLCHYYNMELRRRMAETCPAIRAGAKEEGELKRVFEQRLASPFSQNKLNQWLQNKEREVNVVQSCLDIMKGIPVLSTQPEVDGFVMAPENALCHGFVFTLLGESDPQLEEMRRFLVARQNGTPCEQDLTAQASERPWFCSEEIVSEMRKMAEEFVKTSGSVFIAAGNGDKARGAAVVRFRDGVLANGHFSVSQDKLD